MRISLLSGAYINAGDFLIEKRTLEILKYVYPDADIHKYLRNTISQNLEEIIQSDAVVFGGGPLYMNDLDGYLPLQTCIEKMDAPIFIIGGGWYGQSGANGHVHSYSFTDRTAAFLHKVSRNGGLGCRDLLTYQILSEKKFQNVFLTGCPAWYDIKKVEDTVCRSKAIPEKIVVSDPAQRVNNQGCLRIIDYLKDKYPNAALYFVFHRGTEEKTELLNGLKTKGINILDIAGDNEGFKVYDDCDLHVGYRVHAHIYNLSIRNKSILIEEDGRGGGMNQILGLPGIKAYNDSFQNKNLFIHKAYKRTPFYQNQFITSELDSYLKAMDETNNQYLTNAFQLQKAYFSSMIKFVKSFKKQ